MSSIKNIRFSLPCNENINDMASCGLNKHCKTCDRTIIDFRNKSVEELEQLKKKNQSICGIFSEKQVAKGYERYFQLAAATVLTFGLSSLSPNTNAQEEPDPFKFPSGNNDTIDKPTVIGIVYYSDHHLTADYPGGIAAMKSFLRDNIVYPADSIEGKVYVSLTIDTAGHVTDVKIKKSLSPLADAEVIRVVKLLVFKPAHLNGKPINSTFSLPVNFSRGTKD